MVSIIIDDALQLRSLQSTDAGELFEAVNSSREHLRPWMPWVDMTQKPEHSQQFIQQILHQQDAQEAMALGIFQNARLAGTVGMHGWDHHLKKANLGYWIAKEHEGKGLVLASMKSFIDFLFSKAGLNKVEIHYMLANERSASVARRLGFKVEGVIRQSYILHGNYHDLVVTGLLRNEWKGLPGFTARTFRPV